jgi:hypothetical protein
VPTSAESASLGVRLQLRPPTPVHRGFVSRQPFPERGGRTRQAGGHHGLSRSGPARRAIGRSRRCTPSGFVKALAAQVGPDQVSTLNSKSPLSRLLQIRQVDHSHEHVSEKAPA